MYTHVMNRTVDYLMIKLSTLNSLLLGIGM